jgi:hypothetical protein
MLPWHEVLHLRCLGLEHEIGVVMCASYVFCHSLCILIGPVLGPASHGDNKLDG